MISIASIVSGTALALAAVSNFGWTTVDPCKLITSAEVQGVLGVAIGAPEAKDTDPWRNCTFKGTGGHNLFLTTQDMEQADFERGMKLVKHGLPVGSGMGTDAYTQYGGSGNLFVWKKGTVLTIHLEDQSGNTSPEEREANQEKIAKIALSRL
ncbi:MAG TPA: hypothetical protein VFA43_20350 [Gemmatimonadaceae bacterium]|nr:hypothetical protein [Gemmatimonadaceae bacterium]